MAGKSERLQVSFGSDEYGNETYALLQGSNGYQLSGNRDDDLLSRIKRINSRRKTINFIRLFRDGAYFISDDEGTEWKSVGIHCGKELEKQSGSRIEEVAVAGDKSWAVCRAKSFVTSTGVDPGLEQHLSRFYREQQERNKKRAREIKEYHDRIRREREERERVERAVRQQHEREAREREERETAERLAGEATERNESASGDVSLEVVLEERLVEEAKDIIELEERLRKRKRSLQSSIDQMPPERRSRIQKDWTLVAETPTSAECVVCHASSTPPLRAVVPCGHQCLCDDCASALANSTPESRLCPLCRGTLESTLKIFTSR